MFADNIVVLVNLVSYSFTTLTDLQNNKSEFKKQLIDFGTDIKYWLINNLVKNSFVNKT